MVRVEVYLKGGGVMEVEVDDFNLVQLGPTHKPSALDFVASEEAKQYVPYLDFEEVAAVKVTELEGDGAN